MTGNGGGNGARLQLSRLLVCLATLWPISGCGQKKIAAAGSVTFAGQPVADGLIELIPVEGTPGGPCGTRIADGTYAVHAGAGLKPGGVYKVVLRGFRRQMQPDPTNPAHMVEVAENYLPADWGEQSTHHIEISADGSASRHDFDLEPRTETRPGR